jgi:hypothetical protein
VTSWFFAELAERVSKFAFFLIPDAFFGRFQAFRASGINLFVVPDDDPASDCPILAPEMRNKLVSGECEPGTDFSVQRK